jgi:hypothetical protein
LLLGTLSSFEEAILAVDVALFVSKRLMPVAAALLLLSAARLATSEKATRAPPPSTEVRVVIGR